MASWPDSFHLEPHPVDACQRGYVERPSIVVTPGQVVRLLGAFEGAKMLPLRRKDPYAAGTGDVEIARTVNFHSVDGVFSGRGRHIEKHLTLVQRSIRPHRIAHHDLALRVPVADVEIPFVRGKRETVRPAQIARDQRDGA